MKILSPTRSGAINLALDTLKIGKQALVFVNTKRSAEKTAEDLSKQIKDLGGRENTLQMVSKELLDVLSSPTKQCKRLAFCAKKGVAFHHSGLTYKQRDIIEEGFRSGVITVICATPSLAAGVDTPAFRTILKDLKRFGHRGMDWIPVLEYEQMAGRAGRPDYETYGEAIAIATTEQEAEDIYEKYVCGMPEEIQSKLAVEPVLRMYLLSLISMDFVNTEEAIMDFFSKTFWASQYKDMGHLQKIIARMLRLLHSYGFIEMANASASTDFVSAADMETGRITATKLGKRVAELYIDPYTANDMLQCTERAETKLATEFSYLHMVSSQLELRPTLRVRKKELEEVEQKLVEWDGMLIKLEPSLYDPEYDDFLAAFKTAWFFDEWMDEKDEEYLLEKFNVRPGEIRVKLDSANWLLYAAGELARIQKRFKQLKIIQKARLRLRYGVREELLPLLRLSGIGRVRARKLFRHKICGIEDVKKADITTLVQILGKSTAIAIKNQVGQEFRPEKVQVRENKRKGQMSLLGY